jgi:hypothetical protein
MLRKVTEAGYEKKGFTVWVAKEGRKNEVQKRELGGGEAENEGSEAR